MNPFLLLPVLGISGLLQAQTMTNDSGTFVLHRFATGELSSKEWTDADHRWGHCWAYDRQGHVIYEQQTRHFAGHATVVFRYHPGGGVSRADYSSAPDGGMQWYKSTTIFDEEGRQTSFSEQGQGNDGPIPAVVAPPARTKPRNPPTKPVTEQRMFTNEYFVVNGFRKPVRVELRPKETSPAAKDLDATLLKGDTLRGGAYSMGEQWVGPLGQVAVRVRPAKGRKKLGIARTDTVQTAPDHRRYYLIVGKVR